MFWDKSRLLNMGKGSQNERSPQSLILFPTTFGKAVHLTQIHDFIFEKEYEEIMV